MSQDMSAFVERYQEIYEKDPSSKVFAPLAEAYRRMGLLDEAIELAEAGIKQHPHFSSGHVALGKCYAQKNRHGDAIIHLKAAVDISPENILAHQLLAESYLKEGQMAQALQAYKMVLFFNPNDKKTAEIVHKLEKDVFFSEDQGDDAEEFSMQKLSAVAAPSHTESSSSQEFHAALTPPTSSNLTLERELALVDIRMDRGQWKEAKDMLTELYKHHPLDKEVLARREKLKEWESSDLFWDAPWIQPMGMNAQNEKRLRLEGMLNKIALRRRS